MKNLIILIACLLVNVSVGQTKLDSLVFEKINEYRVSKHIAPIKWDADIWKAANHHAKYLTQLNVKNGIEKVHISHYEDSTYNGILSLRTADDRIQLYTDFKTASECVNFCYTNTNNDDLNKVANHILEIWKKSPPHNKAILEKELKYGAICVDYCIIKNIGDCYKSMSVFNACFDKKSHRSFAW